MPNPIDGLINRALNRRPARVQPPDDPFALPEWAMIEPHKLEPFAKGKTGEELFDLILSGIREIYEVDATIAGGAVRDFAAGGYLPKDVDVFIPLDPKLFLDGTEELGWQGPTGMVRNSKNKYKKVSGEVGCLFHSTGRGTSHVQGTTVDLVFMEQPLSPDDVRTFPVFAQRGVWTLAEGLALAPEAKKDIENKTFTIDPTITDKVRLMNVLEKVHGWQKRPEYAEWKIIEPDIKEWWEAKEEKAKKDAEAPKIKPDNGWATYQKIIVGQAEMDQQARMPQAAGQLGGGWAVGPGEPGQLFGQRIRVAENGDIEIIDG